MVFIKTKLITVFHEGWEKRNKRHLKRKIVFLDALYRNFEKEYVSAIGYIVLIFRAE